MRLFYIVLALGWLALVPPLFTGGRCTSEFDAASARFESNKALLASPSRAERQLAQWVVPFTVLSPEDCRRAKPRFLQRCGTGPLVYARVPVQDAICRFYRDDSTRVQLHYDERGRLERIVSDMAPYRSLPLPWGGQLHWAR